MDLTTENFFDIVGKDKYVLVKFYTRWCGYCRIMHPEYDKLNEIMKETRDDVIIARLEGSINEDITLIYEIFSFPKIVLYHPGSVDIKGSFRGQRIASVMQSWIEQNAPRLEKKLKYLDEDKSNNKENVKNVRKESEKKSEKIENNSNRKDKSEKNKSYDLEDNIDAKKINNNNNIDNNKVTGEVEFLKNEILNMKNRVVNIEKDIEELKSITAKNVEMINKNTNLNSNKKIDSHSNDKVNNIPSEKEESANEEKNTPEEIALKLKMIKDKKKKGEGFFDKMTTFDAIIYVGIFLFLVGTVVTIKKIVFKKGKGFLTSEHVKV